MDSNFDEQHRQVEAGADLRFEIVSMTWKNHTDGNTFTDEPDAFLMRMLTDVNVEAEVITVVWRCGICAQEHTGKPEDFAISTALAVTLLGVMPKRNADSLVFQGLLRMASENLRSQPDNPPIDFAAFEREVRSQN